MNRAWMLAALLMVVAGFWFTSPLMPVAIAADAQCPCQSPLPKWSCCISMAWVPGPHHCRALGYWQAPYLTPYTPSCTPIFFAGPPLDPEPPEPETVIRLRPIPTGKPPEPPPQRPITSEPVRPVRPPIDLDIPPDQPPIMPMTTARIHLLTLVDSDVKELGKVHTNSADLFTKLLRSGIRAERFGEVKRLGSADLSAATVMQTIKNMEVKPDDTIVVFYAGGAEFDEAKMGFQLTPSQAPAKWPREDLKNALESKNVRLVVLLSDPASELVLTEPSSKPELPDPGATTLERLFFGYKGIVDMHGCSAGEFAAARGTAGGCFTLAFVREFGRPAGSWADLLEGVKFTTNNLFKSYRLDVLRAEDLPVPVKATYRNQESQIPAALTPLDNIKPAGSGAYIVPNLVPPIELTMQSHKPAQLQLRVPAAAVIYIDGQTTLQTGAERRFKTGPMAANQSRTHEVKMEVAGWVGVYQVTVTGGQTTKVDLVVPENVVAGR